MAFIVVKQARCGQCLGQGRVLDHQHATPIKVACEFCGGSGGGHVPVVYTPGQVWQEVLDRAKLLKDEYQKMKESEEWQEKTQAELAGMREFAIRWFRIVWVGLFALFAWAVVFGHWQIAANLVLPVFIVYPMCWYLQKRMRILHGAG